MLIFGEIYYKKEKWGKRAWFNPGLELFRGAERDLKMPKTAFITKSPCLFLEKFTLKKKQLGKRAWFNLGPELFRVVERVLNMLKKQHVS